MTHLSGYTHNTASPCGMVPKGAPWHAQFLPPPFLFGNVGPVSLASLLSPSLRKSREARLGSPEPADFLRNVPSLATGKTPLCCYLISSACLYRGEQSSLLLARRRWGRVGGREHTQTSHFLSGGEGSHRPPGQHLPPGEIAFPFTYILFPPSMCHRVF